MESPYSLCLNGSAYTFIGLEWRKHSTDRNGFRAVFPSDEMRPSPIFCFRQLNQQGTQSQMEYQVYVSNRIHFRLPGRKTIALEKPWQCHLERLLSTEKRRRGCLEVHCWLKKGLRREKRNHLLLLDSCCTEGNRSSGIYSNK